MLMVILLDILYSYVDVISLNIYYLLLNQQILPWYILLTNYALLFIVDIQKV